MTQQFLTLFSKSKTIGVTMLLLALTSTSLSAAQQPGHATAITPTVVSNWWPVQDARIDGIQPFKAVVDGQDINSYRMYWSVDGGNQTLMESNYIGSSHKQAEVNIAGWNWQPSNNYVLTFTVKSLTGRELGRTSFTIHNATPAPILPPSTPAVLTQPPMNLSTSFQTQNTTPMLDWFVDPQSPARVAADNISASQPLNSLKLSKIANQATAKWFGGWNASIAADTAAYVKAAGESTPLLVAYNIPQRDCGGYSAGGASSSSYLDWIRGMASGIGAHPAWVILEPDALAGLDCLSVGDQASRLSLLSQAVTILRANPSTRVYLDGGNPRWQAPSIMATRLKAANVDAASGFSTNVSNFISTSENTNYGLLISRLIGGKHFVIDTSRNGNGPAIDGAWCNPAGRTLGSIPTTLTASPAIDAYLWVKSPGESDGACNGGPAAGHWWTDYALGLSS